MGGAAVVAASSSEATAAAAHIPFPAAAAMVAWLQQRQRRGCPARTDSRAPAHTRRHQVPPPTHASHPLFRGATSHSLQDPPLPSPRGRDGGERETSAVCVRACVRAYVRACVRTYVRACVRACVCTRVRACVRACNVRTRTHMRARVRALIGAAWHVNSLWQPRRRASAAAGGDWNRLGSQTQSNRVPLD